MMDEEDMDLPEMSASQHNDQEQDVGPDDEELEQVGEDLKNTNLSRDQKVAFHKGLQTWDQKIADMLDKKNQEIEDKLPQ